MVKTNTLTVKFRRAGTENEYFLAWTTTPWTLASNTALTVGPDIDYIKARMTESDEEGNIFYVADIWLIKSLEKASTKFSIR